MDRDRNRLRVLIHENEVLKRFASVESKVRERDPDLYEQFSKLRNDVSSWNSAVRRISYQSDLSMTHAKDDLEEDIPAEEPSDHGIEQEVDQEGEEEEKERDEEAMSEEEEKEESCPDVDPMKESPQTLPSEGDDNDVLNGTVSQSVTDDQENEEATDDREKEEVTGDPEEEGDEGESEPSPALQDLDDELSEDVEMMLDPHCNPPLQLGKKQKLKYKPRLNVVWQRRLEASQKEREERMKETEAGKSDPQAQNLKTTKNKAYASVPCRIYEKQPKQPHRSPEEFTQESQDLDIFDTELDRRKSFPQVDPHKDPHHLGIDCKIEPRGNRSSELRYLRSTALKAADTDLKRPGFFHPLSRANSRHALSEAYSRNVSNTLPLRRSNTIHLGTSRQNPNGTTAEDAANKESLSTALSLKPVQSNVTSVNHFQTELRRAKSLTHQGPTLLSHLASSKEPVVGHRPPHLQRPSIKS
ncbi:cilia- and flagella-associated protein 251-like [Macrobrachium nipponense]|uniref:cilia- and flagella-associated protein 251-like n=1 Tax=Macrobrachium nipponense TaxID=159736 RepID=UPI0030C822FF